MSDATMPEGPCEQATLKYKATPTLEQYVALRRADPSHEIEVSILGGMDALFALEHELAEYGIEAHPLVTGVLDADPEATSELSLRLMESLIQSRALGRDGETHLIRRGVAMPDSLMDWLICLMLETQSANDRMELNRDLIVLIRERLGGANQHYRQVVEANGKKREAKWLGAQLRAAGRDASIRKVADMLQLSPSTIQRWFPNGEFEREVTKLAVFFNADGSPRTTGGVASK